MELYPNKSGTVLDLLNEAKSKIEFSKDSTRELRFMEIISFKITHLLANDIILECLNPTGTKAYRVDEVPKDQLNLEPSEFLLPVAHFNKETYQTFGIPFLLKVKNVCSKFVCLLTRCSFFSSVERDFCHDQAANPKETRSAR